MAFQTTRCKVRLKSGTFPNLRLLTCQRMVIVHVWCLDWDWKVPLFLTHKQQLIQKWCWLIINSLCTHFKVALAHRISLVRSAVPYAEVLQGLVRLPVLTIMNVMENQ